MFSRRQSGDGSVMVWGAIGYLKKMPLSFIFNRMNAQQYQQMVGPYFPAYGFECAGLNWQFQQDNAPIHVARSTLVDFEQRGNVDFSQLAGKITRHEHYQKSLFNFGSKSLRKWLAIQQQR